MTNKTNKLPFLIDRCLSFHMEIEPETQFQVADSNFGSGSENQTWF
jgi:hypothetical protein